MLCWQDMVANDIDVDLCTQSARVTATPIYNGLTNKLKDDLVKRGVRQYTGGREMER